MIFKSDAILFRKVNHGETSCILTFFTQKKGLVSAILKGARSKSNKKTGVLLPLSISSLEIYQKRENQMAYVRSISPAYVFKSINSNITKSSIVLFLNEVFIKTIKEEEFNPYLYLFLTSTITSLDQKETSNNFHLIALVKLAKELGFHLAVDPLNNDNYFDLEKGYTSNDNLNSVHTINLSEHPYFIELLGTNFDNLETLKLTTTQRKWCLEQLILYFQLHSHGLKNLVSLDVLQSIFSD